MRCQWSQRLTPKTRRRRYEPIGVGARRLAADVLDCFLSPWCLRSLPPRAQHPLPGRQVSLGVTRTPRSSSVCSPLAFPHLRACARAILCRLGELSTHSLNWYLIQALCHRDPETESVLVPSQGAMVIHAFIKSVFIEYLYVLHLVLSIQDTAVNKKGKEHRSPEAYVVVRS